MTIKTLKKIHSDWRITENSNGLPQWHEERWPGAFLNKVKIIRENYQAKVKDNLQVIFPDDVTSLEVTLPSNPKNGDRLQILDAEYRCSDTTYILVNSNSRGIGDDEPGDADTLLLTIPGIRVMFTYNEHLRSWDFIFNRAYNERSYPLATMTEVLNSITIS